MLQIQNVLVSLDLAEQFFCCDLQQCLGACCIEGDAGAPVTAEEAEWLKEAAPKVRHLLTPGGCRAIDEDGPVYIDQEGDTVTQLIEGRECAFSCREPGGLCLCALEKSFRDGNLDRRKPQSCYLYPLRLKEFPTFTAVNYHRWKICRSAEANGRRLGIRLYQFMREPLIERFGAEWYAELAEACEAYLKEYPDGIR